MRPNNFLVVFFLLLSLRINAAAPTIQATNVSFSSISSTSVTISWTNGNGSARCVFMKQTTTSESASPSNGTTYTGNLQFGSGTQISPSTGWYCVYNGSGSSSITVTGLSAGRTYRVHVLDYNITPSNPTFKTGTATGNPNSQVTPPSTQATLSFSNVSLSGMTVNIGTGNGTSRVVFRTTNVNASDPTIVNGNSFTVGNTYNTDWICVYNSTGNSFTQSNLNANTSYKFRAIEYSDNSPSASRLLYLTSSNADNPKTQATLDYQTPSTQTSSITFSNVSDNSCVVSWSLGDGSSSAVFIANTTTGTPTIVDNSTYTASSNFGSGSDLGNGWYCVYNGSGTSVEIFSLTQYQTYRILVCSYNGTSGLEKYLTSATEDVNISNVFISSSKVWNGSSWDGGAPTSAYDALINGDYSNSANIVCNNLTINGGYTVNVQAGSSITTYADLTNYGSLNLLSPSNSGATGSLITYGNVFNYGTMAMQRYISPGTEENTNYTWHFMSPPVANASLVNTFRLDYALDYTESANIWADISQRVTTLVPGNGYMIKTLNAKTASFSGDFNSGTYNITVTNTGADDSHGYNLIGNPYPSAIDWDEPSFSKTNITNTIWIWDPSGQNYMTYNGFVGTNGGTNIIPAMQGFFVKVNSGSASGQVSFTDAVRVHSSQSFQKGANLTPELIRLEVNRSNIFKDEFVLYIHNGENIANKFLSMNDSVPQIYAVEGSKLFSIYQVDLETLKNGFTLPIAFKCNATGKYQINTKELTLPSSLDIKLIDLLKKDTFDLRKSAIIDFDYKTSDTLQRFKLSLKASDDVKVKDYQKAKLNIWSFNQKVFVNLPFSGISKMEIFSTDGKKLKTQILYEASQYAVDLNSKGIFIVRIINNNQLYSAKVYIK